MTTPTQAQIEAGEYDLKCTNGHDRCYMGTSEDCPYCERVALTAAAEAGQSDKCANCGYPKAEHHHEGACYGLCGEFVSAAETDIRFREFGSGATWVDFTSKEDAER